MNEFLIEARGVSKRFRIPGQPALEVLADVSLEVAPGERVAIMGKSGAGKSTLLNILGGLERPTSGTVRRPRDIGFVFQRFHLMPELTVFENVLLPTMSARCRLDAAAARKRAAELVERVGLAGRMEHLPSELSGGEMQRVALARALVANPRAVFADEPTGNLDAETGAGILKVLSELSEGVALVMVTHSPSAAAICDRRLALENRRLIVV